MKDEAVAACRQSLLIAEESGAVDIEQGARFTLAGLYLQQDRIDEAKRELANCPPVDKTSVSYLYIKALHWDVQLRSKNYEAAHEITDKLHEHLQSRNAAAYLIGYVHAIRARCYVKQNLWDAAEESIEKAIRDLQGTDKIIDASTVQAEIYMNTGRGRQGATILQDLLSQPISAHQQAKALSILIGGLQEMGDFKTALKYFQKEVEFGEQVQAAREEVERVWFLSPAEQERLEKVAQQQRLEASSARDQLRVSEKSAVDSKIVQNVSIAAALLLIVGASSYIRSLNRVRIAQVEKEQTQDKLSRKEQLEGHLRFKSIGKLTGSVAHDLNNVLQIISQSYEILQLNGIENPTDEQKQWMKSSLESVEMGARITSQLLAYARQEEMRPEVQLVRDLFDSFWMLFDSVGENDCDFPLSLNSTTRKRRSASIPFNSHMPY